MDMRRNLNYHARTIWGKPMAVDNDAMVAGLVQLLVGFIQKMEPREKRGRVLERVISELTQETDAGLAVVVGDLVEPDQTLRDAKPAGRA